VYDGTMHVGSIAVDGVGARATYKSRSLRRQLGTFSNIKAAIAAIPSQRLGVRVPRKLRERGGAG
jgi:hypothetical protein